MKKTAWRHKIIIPALILGGLLWSFCCGASMASQEATEWIVHPEARWRLIDGGAGEDGSRRFGLQMVMAEGWHSYWRSPGDAGMPLSVATEGSRNVARAELLWPAPERLVESWGLQTFAYSDEVVWPIRVTPQDAAQPVTLRVSVSYNVCKELCIPYDKEEAELTAAMDREASPALAALVAQGMARVPQPNGAHGMTIQEVAHEPGMLRVRARRDAGFSKPDLFVEVAQDDGHRFLTPQIAQSEGGAQAEFRIPHETTLATATLEGRTITLTLVDGGKAVEKTAPFSEMVSVVTGPEAQAPSLWLMLAFALLGGLILNVMPCVLPVLSLKVLALLRHTQDFDRTTARRSFLISASGIVACFLALAGVVVALRGAGMAVGWGFHFQQPAFLAVLILILLGFAANLFGLFEIRLPGRLGDAAVRASHRTGPWGDFFAGAFATLLATPCTAPFLGTAVGFALAAGAAEIFLIFGAMGLGLALPYLAIAAVPTAALLLPRPGAWMVAVKKVLAVFLLATALWLGWVMSLQLQTASSAAAQQDAALWKPFEPERIPALVEEGKTVFVDITASWCLTCKANKALVLDTEEIRSLLAAPGVVAMQGDWTNPDARIAAFLQAHGRYGIPFNAVFSGKYPKGLILSEVLTSQAVQEAVAGRLSE